MLCLNSNDIKFKILLIVMRVYELLFEICAFFVLSYMEFCLLLNYKICIRLVTHTAKYMCVIMDCAAWSSTPPE